ncbi:MAG: hypothetical protein AAF960_08005 [Bacteroidota bacterium]
MKNYLLISFLCFVALGCSKENNLPLALVPTQLLKTIEHTSNNQNWKEDYIYDAEDRLVQVNDWRGAGMKYELTYNEARLVEVQTFQISNDRPLFRDELTYDQQGRLFKIFNYSSSNGEDLTLSKTSELVYDKEGRIRQRKQAFARAPEVVRVETYFWKDGNIIQVVYGDNDGNTSYIFSYEYDQAINYLQYRKHKVEDLTNWNRNNVIQSELTQDNTGLIDLACNPCEAKVEYDGNYPATMEWPFLRYDLTFE